MSAKKLIEKLTGDLGDKRRWREHRARVKRLPPSYRTTVEALERYLSRSGPISRGDVLVDMLEDLGDLFEQAATDGIPIREIVGEDPVDFAENFQKNYAEGQWVNKERQRLVESIARAETEDSGGTS